MLLKCPHCDDEANIPNALSQYENMPIACHACGGFFFAPPPDPDDPNNPTPPRDRTITRSNRQIECAHCDIPVLIPDCDSAGARHKFSCPACHADLPPLPLDIKSPEVKPPPKALSASRPASKPRTHMPVSILAIAIAIGIGVGVALGVLLSRNMIALDLESLATLSDQLGQRFILFWHQTLAKLSAAI
jgi:hypothetical protein